MRPIIYRLLAIAARVDEQRRRELARRTPDSFKLLRLAALQLAVKLRLGRALAGA